MGEDTDTANGTANGTASGLPFSDLATEFHRADQRSKRLSSTQFPIANTLEGLAKQYSKAYNAGGLQYLTSTSDTRREEITRKVVQDKGRHQDAIAGVDIIYSFMK